MDHDTYLQKRIYSTENSEDINDFEEINDYDSGISDYDFALIKQVQNNPCIYNNKLKESPETISKAWDLVALHLGDTVSDVQTRWRRLRQYFSRERKKIESNPSPVEPTRFYKEIKFIDAFVPRKRTFKRPKKENIPKCSTTIACVSNNTGNDELSQQEESLIVDSESGQIYETGDSSYGQSAYTFKNEQFESENTSEKIADKICKSLGDIAASINHISETLEDSHEEKSSDTRKGGENEAIAELVVKRLTSIKDDQRKNALIKKIINDLYS